MVFMLPRIFVMASYEKEPWFASFSNRVAANPSNSMELRQKRTMTSGIKDTKLSPPVKIEALIDTNY